MFLIEITGGILIEKCRNGKSMLESINNAVALTTENVKLFLPSKMIYESPLVVSELYSSSFEELCNAIRRQVAAQFIELYSFGL